MSVSETLKAAVNESGWTINSLASASGIPQSSLQRFINGERGLSLRTVDKLAKYLGLTLIAVK